MDDRGVDDPPIDPFDPCLGGGTLGRLGGDDMAV